MAGNVRAHYSGDGGSNVADRVRALLETLGPSAAFEIGQRPYWIPNRNPITSMSGMTEQIAPATQTCFGMPGLHRYLGNALVRVRTPLGQAAMQEKKKAKDSLYQRAPDDLSCLAIIRASHKEPLADCGDGKLGNPRRSSG